MKAGFDSPKLSGSSARRLLQAAGRAEALWAQKAPERKVTICL